MKRGEGERQLGGARWALLLVLAGCGGDGQERWPSGSVVLADVEGPIGPATAMFLEGVLERAADEGSAAVVLRIDTPGGLDTSMRAIVRAVMGSTVPVVAFVAPRGSRAASAGVFIVYAAHLAAMSPGTNIGAATPVQLGGGGGGAGEGSEGDDAMSRKAVNDAVAFIRSIAELRGRNADWAEAAVREAASLSASAALDAEVVDLMADDVDSLLVTIDGRAVQVHGEPHRLRTAEAQVVTAEPGLVAELLGVISNPNVALLLMMLGVYGLVFELANPGAIFPGVVGALFLLVGLYALHVLPLNWAGLLLILLGLALFVGEAVAPSFGILGVGGVAAFALGALMLLETDVPGFTLSPWLIVALALISAGFLVLVMSYLIKTRRRPVATGAEELRGQEAEVLAWSDGKGTVFVHGERWLARSNETLRAGDHVRVDDVSGLSLSVRRAPVQEKNP